MRTFLLITVLLSALSAHADGAPIPMPGDNRLVVFSYDKNNTFTVLTIPDAVTDIELMSDEKISAMAVGDSVQWVIAKTDGHVFVKPIRPNIFTSATIVTDKRTYQLTLRASPPGGKWFQRVSWTYPDIILYEAQQAVNRAKEDAERKMKEEEAAKSKESVVVSNDMPGTPIANLNYEYEMKGEASFKPKIVFDDGKFTWILLNKKSQEVPALFLKDGKGKYELVNYIRQGDYLQVQRTFSTAVLKLGPEEVEIINTLNAKQGKKGGFLSGFLPGIK